MKKSRVAFFIIFGISVFLFSGCGDASYLQTKAQTVDSVDAGGLESEPNTAQEEPEDAADATIFVQVSGAVLRPGVYELPSESRIFEAIEQAGGLTDEADDADLNQAGFAADGQRIHVPTKEERMADEEAEADDGKININTASEAELMTLSGIGASKAASIVRYRESHGGFASIEDIMNVEGIKEGTYNKICDQIKI